MKNPLSLSTAEPDFDDHFTECASLQECDDFEYAGLCDCDEIEMEQRKSFAANIADWKNDAERCY